MHRLVRLFAIVLLAALLFGCAKKATVPPLPKPEGTLAVSGFTSPKFTWELLAGYLPEEGKGVDADVLTARNESMLQVLGSHGVDDFIAPSVTRQCREIVVFEQGRQRVSAFEYWLGVGQCIPADYLLVPQVLYWRDRTPDSLGYKQPSSVVIDLYLIHVPEKRIVRRFHFDETQQPLSENLLEAQKFFDRKGRWVSALELAREGLEEGLTELGL